MSLFVEEVRKAEEEEDILFKYKSESKLMALLGHLLFFNKNFMNTLTTTLWSTIYFPSPEFLVNRSEYRNLTTLYHEKKHVYQFRKHPILMPILYMFPQCLAAFSLLAILAVTNTTWLYCLLFLVFLSPLPAPFRTYYEAQGYSFQMERILHVFNVGLFPRDEAGFRKCLLTYYDRSTSPFLSFKYYKMCWTKTALSIYLRYCYATTDTRELRSLLNRLDEQQSYERRGLP